MDNREENSRNTEQDRVDNPVENTVSTTVEPALSENKRERKKREKAEKKKKAPAQGNSLMGGMVREILRAMRENDPRFCLREAEFRRLLPYLAQKFGIPVDKL